MIHYKRQYHSLVAVFAFLSSYAISQSEVGSIHEISVIPSDPAGFVFWESFSDGVLDPSMWCSLVSDPTVLNIAETNGHLEFSSPGNPGGIAEAFIYNCGWSIDALSDFRLRMDYHFDAPVSIANGSVGIAAHCWFSGDPENWTGPETTTVFGDVGVGQFGSYYGSQYILNGTLIHESYSNPAPFVFGTVYFSYHASVDTLTISSYGYDGFDAAVFQGMRTGSGSATANIALSGYSYGSIPGFAGNSAWGDNFRVDEGVLILNCPADLTADGTLDFFDVSAFLTAFGNQDPIADFQPDATFDFFDVSAFLSAFAAGCP